MDGALLLVTNAKILNIHAFEASVQPLILGRVLSSTELTRTFIIINNDPLRISMTSHDIQDYGFIKLNIPQQVLDMLTSDDEETVIMAADLFIIHYGSFIPEDYKDSIAKP